jgi:hypothetical protein
LGNERCNRFFAKSGNGQHGNRDARRQLLKSTRFRNVGSSFLKSRFNGLLVILVLDRSAPVYAINVSYNVGNRNELPGQLASLTCSEKKEAQQ